MREIGLPWLKREEESFGRRIGESGFDKTLEEEERDTRLMDPVYFWVGLFVYWFV